MIYSFTADNLAVFHGNRGRIIVQMQTQSITGWTPPTGSASPLPSIGWTGTTTHADRLFPFSSPQIEVGGDQDAGEVVMRSFSLEATNRTFTTTGIRLSDVIPFNPYTETIHVRMGYTEDLPTNAMRWVYGTVDYNSVSYRMENLSDKDRWYIKFDVADYSRVLETKSVTGWLNGFLKHVDWDVSASNAYISTITSNPASIIGAGRTKIGSLIPYDSDNNIIQSSGVSYRANFKDSARFMRIVDVFQAVSDSLGLEATINDGAAWSTQVSTQWLYNNANYSGSDAENWVATDIDQIYMMSGFFYASPGLSNYNYWNNNWGFWDYDGLTEGALIKKGSILEAVKFIMVSLGLTMSIEINSSGERYLWVREVGKTDATLSGSLDSTLVSIDAEIEPYTDIIGGIQINTEFKDKFVLGQIGNNPLNLDTMFVSGQYVVRKYLNWTGGNSDLYGYGNVDNTTTPWTINIDRGDKEIYKTLYASTDSITPNVSNNAGTAASITDIYTVAAVLPKRGGVTMPSTAISQEFNQGGQYHATLTPLSVDGVVFPRQDNSNYSAFADAYSYWLANYYYSLMSYTDDPVGGLQRQYSRDITLNYPDVLGSNINVGQIVTLDVAGVTTIWRIKSYTVNLADFSTSFVLTSLEYNL